MCTKTCVATLAGALVTILLITVNAPAQTTWYVDDDNCPGPGSGTPADPFCMIQDGIDAAALGDTVVVRDGTYTGPGNKNLDFGGKTIAVRSENGPQTCIIDCENDGRGFHFHSGEIPWSSVNGFTITNGSAEDGGGILCSESSPDILRCIISGNRAGDGGGIYCHDSNSVIENCTIAGNTADHWRGGGIDCESGSKPTITNCAITGNTAPDGGGIYVGANCYPTITDCVLTGNSAVAGGGISSWSGGGASEITNCLITGNTADYFGGMYCKNYSPTITNCTISGNIGNVQVGGICCDGSSPTITNCIVWANGGAEIFVISGSPVVGYCDVQGGWTGPGNINQDPLFADGYHLSQIAAGQGTDSPCVDAGDPLSPMIEGTTRTDEVQDVGVVDMGYHYPVPPYPLVPTLSQWGMLILALLLAVAGTLVVARRRAASA